MKKKQYEKKMQNGIRLLPNCLVNFFFFFFLYCKREGWKKKNCIVIVLQEKGVVGGIVLQAKALYYNLGSVVGLENCIARGGLLAR